MDSMTGRCSWLLFLLLSASVSAPELAGAQAIKIGAVVPLTGR